MKLTKFLLPVLASSLVAGCVAEGDLTDEETTTTDGYADPGIPQLLITAEFDSDNRSGPPSADFDWFNCEVKEEGGGTARKSYFKCNNPSNSGVRLKVRTLRARIDCVQDYKIKDKTITGDGYNVYPGGSIDVRTASCTTGAPFRARGWISLELRSL